MQIACPGCRSNVYSVRQKNRASAFSPLKCRQCGVMAAPSWWSGLALLPGPFVLIFGLWFSLTYRSWWPISAAVVMTIALYLLVMRYFPLARISGGEVLAWRVGAMLVAVFLIGSVALSLAGYRVAL
jgi:hypothetical protein